MKFSKSVEIAKPVAEVWKKFAIEFDLASIWMASVPESYAKTKGQFARDAPMQGRICHLSASKTKNMVDETITEFDQNRHVMKFEVEPLNMPWIFPFSKNKISVELEELDNGNTHMHWGINTELRAAGYLLYPLVKVGLSKGIDNIIEELKFFVENGRPHPRKKVPDVISTTVAV